MQKLEYTAAVGTEHEIEQSELTRVEPNLRLAINCALRLTGIHRAAAKQASVNRPPKASINVLT